MINLWRKNDLFRGLALATSIWLVISVFFRNDLGTQNLTRKIEIHARDFLSKNPKFDPSLKLLLYDDNFAAKIKQPDLGFQEWANLLSAIASRKPKAIIFDKVFSFSFDQENVSILTSFLKNSDTKISVGAFITAPKALPGRNDVTDMVELKEFRGNPHVSRMHFDGATDKTKVKARATGPIAGLAESFSHIGHIVYKGNGNARARLLWQYEKGRLAPHLTITGSKVELKSSGIYINGHKSGGLEDESIPVDIIPTDRYWEYYDKKENRQIFSFVGLMNYVAKKKEFWFIEPGDTVFISKTFSGSTDFIKTPAGRMSGGLFMASLLNSTLTGKWLKEANILKRYAGIPVLALIFIFALFTRKISIKMSSLIVVFVTMAICTLSIYLFAVDGLVIEWLYASSCFFLSAITIVINRALSLDFQSNLYKIALSRTLPKDRLRDILVNPSAVKFDPCYKNVTIMFVDIIKFSSIAERKSSEEVFSDLKKVLNRTIEVIHSHGGVIDKTLGDGILAYFGYRFDDTQKISNHSSDAVRCAIEVQEKNLAENLKEIDLPNFPYVLRIGLNSSSVFIGNIGDQKMPDITLIGQGVNFAQRLEAACEPFKVLVSDATKGEMGEELEKVVDQHITQKEISIKHHKNPKVAWEIDTLKDKSDDCQKVLDKLSKQLAA